ncbi:MAG: Coenzyme F420 hydrogenase/dehydrogenase, beta subunit C-terminal domain [Limisphaerales bacterium]|jgi:coenzyme F420-reducing hydrogenase beta subunit
MINIQNPNDCCGCGACVAICPKKCISMQNNEEGFLYPSVDITKCIDCGLCNKVCSWENKPELLDRLVKLSVYAAWNLDENVRRNSSSGGIFSILAERILKQDGIVVGAAYVDDCKKVEHIIINTPNDISKLRGSKYVQSEINPEVYSAIKKALETGLKVLFSGTPCQSAALRNYLKKNYENLLVCDLVCTGTPPPFFLSILIDNINEKYNSEVIKYNFKDKKFGWSNQCESWVLKNGKYNYINPKKNIFRIAFNKRLSLRYSCYHCKFVGCTRYGDITLGDFWGVKKNYTKYDMNNKGTSLIIINTLKGRYFINSCVKEIYLGEADLQSAVSGNPMLGQKPWIIPEKRKYFILDVKNLNKRNLIKKYNLYQRNVLSKIIRKILKFINENTSN